MNSSNVKILKFSHYLLRLNVVELVELKVYKSVLRL